MVDGEVSEENDEVGRPIEVERQITGVKIETAASSGGCSPIVVKLGPLDILRVGLVANLDQGSIPEEAQSSHVRNVGP